MAYSKLHSSIVGSSLWSEPDNVRILFITLLAMSDSRGYIFGSKPGIERIANIKTKRDPLCDPWFTLLSPDPHSSDKMRNPENEGRRIEEVSGGYRLLNFDYYRGLRNEDDRREQNRAAQARHKAKVSQGKPSSARTKPISEAETETEAERIYGQYPRRVKKPEALKAIQRALSKHPFATLFERTKAYFTARIGADPQYTPHPATWFNNEQFNDDPSTWIATHGTHRSNTPKSNRTYGTANERRIGQYDNVGKVPSVPNPEGLAA